MLRRSVGPGQVLRRIIPLTVLAAAPLVPWPYGWIIEKITRTDLGVCQEFRRCYVSLVLAFQTSPSTSVPRGMRCSIDCATLVIYHLREPPELSFGAFAWSIMEMETSK